MERTSIVLHFFTEKVQGLQNFNEILERMTRSSIEGGEFQNFVEILELMEGQLLLEQDDSIENGGIETPFRRNQVEPSLETKKSIKMTGTS